MFWEFFGKFPSWSFGHFIKHRTTFDHFRSLWGMTCPNHVLSNESSPESYLNFCLEFRVKNWVKTWTKSRLVSRPFVIFFISVLDFLEVLSQVLIRHGFSLFLSGLEQTLQQFFRIGMDFELSEFSMWWRLYRQIFDIFNQRFALSKRSSTENWAILTGIEWGLSGLVEEMVFLSINTSAIKSVIVSIKNVRFLISIKGHVLFGKFLVRNNNLRVLILSK